MNNDAMNPAAPIPAILDIFLMQLIEHTNVDLFATVNPRDAASILAAIPDEMHLFHGALRDAFRDNIDCPDDDTFLI